MKLIASWADPFYLKFPMEFQRWNFKKEFMAFLPKNTFCRTLSGYLNNNRISLVALKLLQTHTRENVIKIPFSLPMLKYTAYSLFSTGVNSLNLLSLNKGSISRNDG